MLAGVDNMPESELTNAIHGVEWVLLVRQVCDFGKPISCPGRDYKARYYTQTYISHTQKQIQAGIFKTSLNQQETS